MKSLWTIGLLGVAMALMAAGCSSRTNIALDYQPAGVYGEKPCTVSMAVVTFKDGRSRIAIGEAADGALYYGTPSVSEWVSRAFYDELGQMGCRVEYHDKEYAFDTDYVVTGVIKDVYVTQTSMTAYQSEMRLLIIVKKEGKQVFGKEYLTKYGKAVIPSSTANQEVLNELLQYMMREVFSDIPSEL